MAASQSSATVTPLGGVVEPLTGITLPSASSDALTMVPKACVRCMLGFCRLPQSRAYVYGLYLDSSALQQRSVGGVLASKAANPAASTLRMQLVVARNAEGEHWAKGFQKSIQRRLQMGDPDVDTGNHLTALVRVFKTLTLAQGDVIHFTWTSRGLQVGRGKGEAVEVLAEVPSHALAAALFDTYVGTEAVSKPCARDIETAFSLVSTATPLTDQ